ncbi:MULTISPECIES: DUF4335 domain-containing protein [Prochlorococcus]|uniref:Uncharacterized membrane protein n=1 Tax=Prochlorococcus marinus (strain SARG / CCMP1375 / SS120) TaxID=167539 RepID=Q7VC33_PROMA|nr:MULTISPECIES: DUF4335 domain-containing protein [Prochlorococcus]AAP99953.1 Uncharacterized membrane protein [Prochlorococcus marinus subsp. marinus str. CCMP1375]KGG11702.1 hypothetical protein EV04_0726 [Prochlorococcus marinus str. LG]KGG18884.1 hypothetical protein EV08_1371 [Prochlorococcus marinus str. SS2]KGG23578.1 hypothetical protein EV09_1202 [Prochlorococcus marinus str. SS35]KGG32186.1 hypothetical protein EV10_1301 [Prochlorococcus marinus str. SS51]
MKLNLIFTSGIARIEIDGLPDHSLGHDNNTLGILLSWKLNLIGIASLDGKKEHLKNLINVVLTYSSYCISGIFKTVSDESKTITISRYQKQNKLTLISTKRDIEPLTIFLDDAELVDLTKCLDQVIHEKKIAIDWVYSINKPRINSEWRSKKNILNRLVHPFIGSFLIMISSVIFLSLSGIIQEEPLIEHKSNISIN